MSDPSPSSDDGDDPGDGLTNGQWVEACVEGDRDWDEYGNA